MAATNGAAGRMAAAFIHSKLTPLFILASMALGVLAVVALPREEEPQIIVPMVDVLVEMPGATPADVEQRVTRPMEQLLREVPGVEYVYSTSSSGQSMVVVRFTVDEPLEPALVRLNRNWPRMRTASRQASSGLLSSRARSTMCRSSPSRCGRRVTPTINCERSRSSCGMPSPKSTTCRR
jgi:multidrug efflux pump subunit AcrB